MKRISHPASPSGIDRLILTLREQKVILDTNLSSLYANTTE